MIPKSRQRGIPNGIMIGFFICLAKKGSSLETVLNFKERRDNYERKILTKRTNSSIHSRI